MASKKKSQLVVREYRLARRATELEAKITGDLPYRDVPVDQDLDERKAQRKTH